MNARMEEMSFRSGVAVFAGVLALAGLGISLAVTLGAGHQAAAVPAAAATAAPSSATPSSAAPSSPAAPVRSASASPIQEAPAEDVSRPGITQAPSSPPPSWPRPSPRHLGRHLRGEFGSPANTPSPVVVPPGW